jgi:CheY-like chemotaxis protein
MKRLIKGLLGRFGIIDGSASRRKLRILLLDDDAQRHRWFRGRFNADTLDIASDVAAAKDLLSSNAYDLIFLDHDLLPEHYEGDAPDDERTGYAVAAWLAEHPHLQPSAKIMVHTRNADGAMRMVEVLRRAGRQAEYIPFPVLASRIKRGWIWKEARA